MIQSIRSHPFITIIEFTPCPNSQHLIVMQVRPETTFIALLRGINVGGKHSLPMATLVKLLNEAGCGNVRTYIQSGNAIFAAGAKCAARLPQLIPTQINTLLGFQPAFIMRSADALRQIIAHNPYIKSRSTAELERCLHVMFLDKAPSAAYIAALDPPCATGESITFHAPANREIYLHLPHGAGRTKLTNAWFDSKLKVTSTMRNWRTVCTLAAMFAAPASSDSA